MIDAAKDHMSTVTTERSLYRDACMSSRKAVKDHFTSEGSFNTPAPGSLVAPCSNHIKIHYSFDMAQQVFIQNALCVLTTHIQITGALSQRPISARTSVFLNPQEMCCVRGML